VFRQSAGQIFGGPDVKLLRVLHALKQIVSRAGNKLPAEYFRASYHSGQNIPRFRPCSGDTIHNSCPDRLCVDRIPLMPRIARVVVPEMPHHVMSHPRNHYSRNPWHDETLERSAQCVKINYGICPPILNGELFLNLAEARYIVDRWRMDYNHHRPHSMLDWKTPAAFAALCPKLGRPATAGGPCVPPGSATPHPPEHTENAWA
jgi:transposase InsO family protein